MIGFILQAASSPVADQTAAYVGGGLAALIALIWAVVGVVKKFKPGAVEQSKDCAKDHERQVMVLETLAKGIDRQVSALEKTNILLERVTGKVEKISEDTGRHVLADLIKNG